MLNLRSAVGFCAIVALSFFAGCAQEQSKAPGDSKAGEQEKEAAAMGDKSAESDKSAELPEGLKELSPEDFAAAQKQKVCPVSDQPLGSMGKPYKVTVKGQTVFLCCSGCEDDLKKDPDKYLAKLRK